MPAWGNDGNIGVCHGAWGESVAVASLQRAGYLILARNVRPCPHDRRLEIDIVAYEKASETLVFVEVKQHARREEGRSSLPGVSRRKRQNLKKACTAWRLRNRWRGNYRFDVIEVYGTPQTRCVEVDHIERVALFATRAEFVDWS